MENPIVERAERLADMAQDFVREVADERPTLGIPDYRYLSIVLAEVADTVAKANRELFRLLADLHEAKNRDYNALQSTLHSTGRRRSW